MKATGRQISIVDDDDSLRHSLANLDSLRRLPHPGFRLRGRVLRSDHARETDCLILDVRMPGMGEQPQPGSGEAAPLGRWGI